VEEVLAQYKAPMITAQMRGMEDPAPVVEGALQPEPTLLIEKLAAAESLAAAAAVVITCMEGMAEMPVVVVGMDMADNLIAVRAEPV